MVDLEESLLSKYHLTYEEYHWRLMVGKPPSMPLLINEVHDALVFDLPKKGRRENVELIETLQREVPTLRKLIPDFTIPLNTGRKLGHRWSDNDATI